MTKRYSINSNGGDLYWKYSERAPNKQLSILTDAPDFQGIDQVFPMHPEHQFFLDEMYEEQYKGKNVLDIGAGSGILSIAAAILGSKVTGLEINKRAKRFAEYNIKTSGLTDNIKIINGHEDLWRPVNEKYDHIISNPPFEPTPQDVPYYTHSDGGPHGTKILTKIIVGLESHLMPEGTAQIVTFALGNQEYPSLLNEVLRNTSCAAIINVAPEPLRYRKFLERFIELKLISPHQANAIAHEAPSQHTHLHMCMLHLINNGKADRTYTTYTQHYLFWNIPLGASVPVGVKKDE